MKKIIMFCLISIIFAISGCQEKGYNIRDVYNVYRMEQVYTSGNINISYYAKGATIPGSNGKSTVDLILLLTKGSTDFDLDILLTQLEQMLSDLLEVSSSKAMDFIDYSIRHNKIYTKSRNGKYYGFQTGKLSGQVYAFIYEFKTRDYFEREGFDFYENR